MAISNFKMVVPVVLSWVEKSHNFFILVILESSHIRPFVLVTMWAAKRKVFEYGEATVLAASDMVNMECRC